MVVSISYRTKQRLTVLSERVEAPSGWIPFYERWAIGSVGVLLGCVFVFTGLVWPGPELWWNLFHIGTGLYLMASGVLHLFELMLWMKVNQEGEE